MKHHYDKIRGTLVTNISHDYIRGLVQGSGTFTFTTSAKLGSLRLRRIPAFQLRLHADNQELLEAITNKLGLKNKIYIYRYNKDGAKRKPNALLIVRELPSLKNVIIPLFYDYLSGDKGKEFNEWLERMGKDPVVPKSYKFLYKLHKIGYFQKELCKGKKKKKFTV